MWGFRFNIGKMGSGGALDTIPLAFAFADQTNVDTASVITSAPVAVDGISGPTPISITGGTYSINGGAYTSSPGLVIDGDSVTVRHTSPAAMATATSTVLTIGGVSDTFTSTTHAPNWAWRASDLSLAPYIGSGTPTVARTGATGTVIDSSGLLAGVAANTARYDYFRATYPDTSGFGRSAFSMGSGVPPPIATVGGLTGAQFDGLDVNDGSQGLNAGVTGFGVSTADGSMKIKATIRRSRTGVTEIIAGKWAEAPSAENWLLYIEATGELRFVVVDSVPSGPTSTGTTLLAAGVNYDVEGIWDGTKILVKVNGAQEGTQPALTALQTPDAITPLSIAREVPWFSAFNNNPYPFQGIISNVEMYRGGVLQGQWALTSRSAPLLVEPSATNIALRNNDQTNAAWVKGATMTAAKDQTGPDGVANSASKLTGGALLATNTSLQTVVLAPSSRVFSAWLKRVTGTGTIEMTTDGGVSWVNVTSSIASVWNRISIPAQTVTNPSFGFRITTNGDAIAVAFVQNETDVLTSATTETAGSAVTRNGDDITLATSGISGFSANPGSYYVKAISHSGAVLAGTFPTVFSLYTDVNNYIAFYRTGTDIILQVTEASTIRADFSVGSEAGAVSGELMTAYATNDVAAVKDGGTVGTDASAAIPAQSTLVIGNIVSGLSTHYWRGWIQEIELYPSRVDNAGMDLHTS